MALAVAEQIAHKLAQRLQTIDEDDGFETTVNGTVVRPAKIWTGNLKDYQIIIAQGTALLNAALSRPGNPPASAWDQTFTIFGELRPSEDDSTPFDALCSEFAADIIRAVTTPVASWYNWDGLAINSTITGIERINGEEVSGVAVELMVTFRTDENNPYQERT
jgi:hypothetical protein